jgi:hypothetical protein
VQGVTPLTITVSTEDPRSCKALALLKGADQWLKIRRESDGVKLYVIPGSAGHVYWTNCRECSCPDSQHHGVECKHITAVKLHVAKIQAERPIRPHFRRADMHRSWQGGRYIHSRGQQS